MYSFSYLEPVCCSMSSSNCCFLTCTQVSQEAGQVSDMPIFSEFSTVYYDPHIIYAYLFLVMNKTSWKHTHPVFLQPSQGCFQILWTDHVKQLYLEWDRTGLCTLVTSVHPIDWIMCAFCFLSSCLYFQGCSSLKLLTYSAHVSNL